MHVVCSSGHALVNKVSHKILPVGGQGQGLGPGQGQGQGLGLGTGKGQGLSGQARGGQGLNSLVGVASVDGYAKKAAVILDFN